MQSHIFSFSLFKTILLASLLFLLFSSSAFAYTITPKAIDVDVERRDIINKTITISNNSNRQVRLYPVVNEVAVSEDGEIKDFEYAMNEDRYDSVTSWIEVSRGRITLRPGDEHELPVRIQINPRAEPGEYHAFIALVNAKDKADAERRALAGSARGVLVRIALEQERTEFLQLDGFMVDRVVTDNSEGVVNYTLKNTGEKEIVPKGEVIFYDTRGKEVGSIPVNPEGQEVASGKLSEFSSPLPEEMSVGKYKAFLSLQYGTDQLASITDTSFFYIVPIEVMLIIFASVLAFALFLTIVIYRKLNPPVPEDGVQPVSMYMREGVSEAQDHDIDLKKQNNNE